MNQEITKMNLWMVSLHFLIINLISIAESITPSYYSIDRYNERWLYIQKDREIFTPFDTQDQNKSIHTITHALVGMDSEFDESSPNNDHQTYFKMTTKSEGLQFTFYSDENLLSMAFFLRLQYQQSNELQEVNIMKFNFAIEAEPKITILSKKVAKMSSINFTIESVPGVQVTLMMNDMVEILAHHEIHSCGPRKCQMNGICSHEEICNHFVYLPMDMLSNDDTIMINASVGSKWKSESIRFTKNQPMKVELKVKGKSQFEHWISSLEYETEIEFECSGSSIATHHEFTGPNGFTKSQNSNLLKLNINEAHDGLWKCNAQNSYGSRESGQILVKLSRGIPHYLRILYFDKYLDSDQDIFRISGQDIQIICKSHSYPTVTHYDLYHTTIISFHMRSSDGSFTLEDSPGLVGRWICIASNELGPGRGAMFRIVDTNDSKQERISVSFIDILIGLLFLVFVCLNVYMCLRIRKQNSKNLRLKRSRTPTGWFQSKNNCYTLFEESVIRDFPSKDQDVYEEAMAITNHMFTKTPPKPSKQPSISPIKFIDINQRRADFETDSQNSISTIATKSNDSNDRVAKNLESHQFSDDFSRIHHDNYEVVDSGEYEGNYVNPSDNNNYEIPNYEDVCTNQSDSNYQDTYTEPISNTPVKLTTNKSLNLSGSLTRYKSKDEQIYDLGWTQDDQHYEDVTRANYKMDFVTSCSYISGDETKITSSDGAGDYDVVDLKFHQSEYDSVAIENPQTQKKNETFDKP